MFVFSRARPLRLSFGLRCGGAYSLFIPTCCCDSLASFPCNSNRVDLLFVPTMYAIRTQGLLQALGRFSQRRLHELRQPNRPVPQPPRPTLRVEQRNLPGQRLNSFVSVLQQSNCCPLSASASPWTAGFFSENDKTAFPLSLHPAERLRVP